MKDCEACFEPLEFQAENAAYKFYMCKNYHCYVEVKRYKAD